MEAVADRRVVVGMLEGVIRKSVESGDGWLSDETIRLAARVAFDVVVKDVMLPHVLRPVGHLPSPYVCFTTPN